MHSTTYRPGAWNVLVTEHIVVALPEGTDVGLLSALWDGSEQCRDLTVLIEMLTEAVGGSLSALPAFGAVLLDDGVVRVAVRGAVSVTADVDGEVRTLSGADASTWSEHLLRGATRVQVHAEETSQPELPLIGGVVRAGELTIVSAGTADADLDAADADLDAAADALPATEALPVTEALPATEALPVQPDAEPAPIGAFQTGAPASGSTPAPEPSAAPEPTPAPEPRTAPEPQPVADAPSGPAADLPVPPTFIPSAGGVPAAVLASPVEDIVRTIIPEREEAREVQPEGEPTPAAGTPEAPDAAAAAASDVDDLDMLWAQTVHRAPRAHTVPVASEPEFGDHDGATISAAQARNLRRPVIDQEANTEVLPVVAQGRLRMSTGQEIALDRTVIIGRRPRATRASGDTLPRLVAVESPQQDISRNHLEVRPEDNTVVVVDLHTTNGTTLLRPGSEPLRLHPGEPTLVVDGDTVDLGDGVTVVFEGLA